MANMASILSCRICVMVLLISLCVESKTKSTESDEVIEKLPELKTHHKQMNEGASLMFADEFKQILERYLFGICPQTFKIQLGLKGKNITAPPSCDVDADQQDLAGRLATLSLRAHSASRSDCSRLGTALANTLGELARTAANRAAITHAANEANKKRKLSKSQKAKIQAKQRTALAVKKKAAAAAAAAAAKMAS